MPGQFNTERLIHGVENLRSFYDIIIDLQLGNPLLEHDDICSVREFNFDEFVESILNPDEEEPVDIQGFIELFDSAISIYDNQNSDNKENISPNT